MSSKALDNVIKLNGLPVNVKEYGAKGDGVTDDTAAIAAAHATGKPVFYPYGDYKHVGYFPECEGGIIGEGWSTNNGAKRTAIIFYNCTDPQRGAITPKQTLPKSQWFLIQNIMILSSSWDAGTGCLGYGLDLGTPVRLDTVYIGNFKRSNLWWHHVTAGPASGSAPYESICLNVYSAYSGEHGCLVGSGANVLTFIGYQGKWSGAPSFGVQPSGAGNFDGFHVAATADGNTISNYNPEAVTVINGDCSYNSRYGWNLETVRASVMLPGYAEGNLVKEARIGDIRNCKIMFQQMAGELNGFLDEQDYVRYWYTNTITLGGKQISPDDYFGFIANPNANDLASNEDVINAPTRNILFSRSNDGTKQVYIRANGTPDGTAVDKDTETVATFRGFGSGAAIGIGDGSRHLKVLSNFIRLPDIYYQATATGWNAGSVRRGIGTAAPTIGTYARGDIVWNSEPSAGGPPGWVCVTAGSPGTWKAMANVAA